MEIADRENGEALRMGKMVKLYACSGTKDKNKGKERKRGQVRFFQPCSIPIARFSRPKDKPENLT
jgi:hypothetical protein